jgi:CRISPR/Cas system type I-B associated protein Csh2 (Cas7 group RAMP superfamily)
VTTTEVVSGFTNTKLVTSLQTGTFVAAQIAAATSTTGSQNAAPTLGSKQSVEALVIVGMVVMVAL